MGEQGAASGSGEMGTSESPGTQTRAWLLVLVSLFALSISVLPVLIVAAIFFWELDPAGKLRSIPLGIIKSEGLTPIHGLILPAVAGLTAYSSEAFFRPAMTVLICVLFFSILCAILAIALMTDTEQLARLQLTSQSATLKTFLTGQLNGYLLYLMILIGLKAKQ